VGEDREWIDRAARSPVAFLYGGEMPWTTVYENIFWNRKITGVGVLPGFDLPGPVPQTALGVTTTGLVVSSTTRPPQQYVVSARSIVLRGRPVAEAGALAGTPRLVLWRVARPLRVSAWLAGLPLRLPKSGSAPIVAYGDLDATRARLVVYACDGGTLSLDVAAVDDTSVVVQRQNHLVAAAVLKAGAHWKRTIRLARSSRRTQCEFDISSSQRVRVERLSFTRIDG
jgi:hypothetical protein